MISENSRSGSFITFEGIDGSGKSTQIELLAKYLEDSGYSVLLTREPGGTELGLKLRNIIQHGDTLDARTEALLFAADRAYHVENMIKPALSDGTIVLCDRYIDSSVAYQGAARKLGDDTIRSLSEWAVDGLSPDLTILIDTPETVAHRRMLRSGNKFDRIEEEGLQIQRDVRQKYLSIAANNPERVSVVSGDGTVNQVFSNVLEALGMLEKF